MFQLRWVLHNMKGRRVFFFTGLFLSAFSMILAVISPKFTVVLIDDVLTGGQKEKLLPALAWMMGIQLVRTLLRYAMVMCLETSSQHTVTAVRMRVFRVLQHQDAAFYNLYRTGDLMTRITGDMDLIRHFVAWISFQIVDSVTVFVAALILLGTIHVPLTLMMLTVSPVIAVVSGVFTKKIRPLFAAQRERLSALNTFAQENIAGNRVVKAFSAEEYEIGRFKEKNDEFRNANLTVTRTWLKFFPFIETAASSLTVIAILAGGLFIMKGSLTFGELTAFNALTWAIANPMRNLGTLLNDFQRFFVSADKVIELFYSRPLITDPAEPVPADEPLKGEIRFENVSFRYKSADVLKNVSFHIRPGQTVGIMGPTGSGKTTVAHLICRFYDASEGTVSVDGVPVNRYRLNDLRRNIGVATQEVFLFSDTAHGNIAYGVPDLSREDATNFARMAEADEFLSRMPEGYDTVVGERGVGLSGGQRQRLALARALAVRPSVLILDDTTSALDSKTESRIRQQLKNPGFPCTKIIIAQRVSSVRDADQIFVLENGELTVGTHEVLVRRPGYYRDVCELQNAAEIRYDAPRKEAVSHGS